MSTHTQLSSLSLGLDAGNTPSVASMQKQEFLFSRCDALVQMSVFKSRVSTLDIGLNNSSASRG